MATKEWTLKKASAEGLVVRVEYESFFYKGGGSIEIFDNLVILLTPYRKCKYKIEDISGFLIKQLEHCFQVYLISKGELSKFAIRDKKMLKKNGLHLFSLDNKNYDLVISLLQKWSTCLISEQI